MQLDELLAHATPEEAAEIDALLAQSDHVEYRHDPMGWIVAKLGVRPETIQWSLLPEYQRHRWDGSPDPLFAMMRGLATGDDVGVEAATGTQKSFTAACLILWFLACWEGARAFTFAPKEDQLRLFIWMEIGKLWPAFQVEFPNASLTDLCIRMRGGTDDSWGARGYAVAIKAGEAVSTNAQGMHAEHMLLVYEETPGIDQAVIEAGENTCTAPHNIRLFLGNPDHQLDTLHVACTSPGVQHIRISALDHPNVLTGREIVPGAASAKSIERRKGKYGEESPVYISRVRGISPAEATDALIKLAWCNAAAERWARRELSDDDVPAIGVDVAQSEHGDKASIARGRGNRLTGVTSFACNNATKLGTDVAAEAKRDGVAASNVGVDSVGVGAATANELRSKLGGIQALNGGESPVDGAQKGPEGHTHPWMPDANEHRNLRGQMWWQMREDLRLGDVDLPLDPELFRQLTMVTFKTQNGVVVVEGKPELRKRLGRSPDDADAAVYWNWVRPRRLAVKHETVPAKTPHRAQPITIEDGKVVAAPKIPKTLEELAEWAAQRAHTGRLPTRDRERLPRSPRRTR